CYRRHGDVAADRPHVMSGYAQHVGHVVEIRWAEEGCPDAVVLVDDQGLEDAVQARGPYVTARGRSDRVEMAVAQAGGHNVPGRAVQPLHQDLWVARGVQPRADQPGAERSGRRSRG